LSQLNSTEAEELIDIIIDILAGKQPITNKTIENIVDPKYKELLVGLMVLSEDANYNAELRKKLERNFSNLDKLHTKLFQNIPVPICFLNENLECESYNDSFEDYFEISPSVKKIELDTIIPDLRNIFDDYLNVLKGKLTNFQLVEKIKLITTTGETNWGIINMSSVDLEDEDKYILIIQDITSFHNLEEELTLKSDELVKNNMELENLTRITTQDLKEPIRLINNYAQLLQKRNFQDSNDSSGEWINSIISTSKRIKGLLEEVMTFTTITDKEVDISAVDVSLIVEQVKLNLNRLIIENNVQINYSDLPSIRADKYQLLEIFQNLISFIIKNRGDINPEITIKYKEYDTNWIFLVVDNGMRIDPNYFTKLFSSENSLYTNNVNSSVSLAICKKIIEFYKGHIWVESNMGIGSIFYFTISKEV